MMRTTLSTRPFTVDDYHRMAETGILQPDERVELLDGRVVPMSPIGYRHAATVDFLTDWFVNEVRGRAHVRVQGPVPISGLSEPQPDLALLTWRADRYRQNAPTVADVLLIIEVSDSTLEKDQGEKLEAYAEAGVRDYWVVDLTRDAIWVYRQPAGRAYLSSVRLSGSQCAVPLLLPDVSLRVGSIFGDGDAD